METQMGGMIRSTINAIYWAGRIHLFMTVAQVNAWHYWWLIPWGGTDNQGLTDASGHPAKRMYAVGQFSRFVRPGFNRIGANVTDSAALVSAYKDSASPSFAIVVINPTDAALSQTYYLSNFTGSSVSPWLTTAALSMARQSAISVANSSFTYEMPAMSLVTFTGQAVVSNVTLAVAANPTDGGIVTGGGIYNVGSQVQISASPDAGWVFTGWSDGSTENPRTVTVPSGGATFEGGFTFKGLNSKYVGLFYDTNGIAPQSSGAFSAKLTSTGGFSATLALGGNTYSFAGRFSSNATTSNSIPRFHNIQLAVQLSIDSFNGVVLNG